MLTRQCWASTHTSEQGIFSTANSTLVADGHEVELVIPGLDFHLMVYFYEEPQIRRNLLGRGGWLQQIKLGLVDYEQALYLSRYSSE
jgi:hypothetical protein